MAALGRPFTLGMLYDSRTDQLIPGVTLWDGPTIQKNTTENSQHSSEFEVTTSDSIESKSSLLDVNGSLQASFMGGLIEVGGSAKYLNDKKKSHNQSRVTFQYKATTTFRQLLVTDLGTIDSQQIDVIEQGLATHVVTGILYGANAFFVFDSEKLDEHCVQDIQGKMQALIKKIPSFSINRNIDIKLTDEEKALADKLSCKFYGDFILESNPTTFEDAVKIYQKLPKLLGENDKNVVPLNVWMLPLKNLNLKAAKVKPISTGLVRKAHDALEDLHHLEILCNDYLDDTAVKSFPTMQEKLRRFQTLCVCLRSALQQTLVKKLPSIRAGEEDETEVNKVFEDSRKSPFSYDKLTKWLEDKEREINVIRSCVEMMEGIKIVPNQSKLDREVLAPCVEDVICFVFTSLETREPYLEELADYVDSLKVKSDGGVHTSKQDLWCYSDEVITKMRDRARGFNDFAKAQKNKSRMLFLVAAIANEKHNGASIYHYKKAILLSDDYNFSPITVGPVETLRDRDVLLPHARSLTLDPETANHQLILSAGNKKVTHGRKQVYPDHHKRFYFSPQVLCKEGLTGLCYWEVEWSTVDDEDIGAAVSYQSIPRNENHHLWVFGCNDMSWSLGHRWREAHTFYSEYNNVLQDHPFPSTGCSRLGVFLDWPAGTLSYYNVCGNTLTHIHTFRTRFTEPVYPGFKIWQHNSYLFLPL